MSKSFRLFLGWIVAVLLSPAIIVGIVATLLMRAFTLGSGLVDLLIDYLSGE